MSTQKTIMGIDPGTNHMGYAIIKINQNKIEVVRIGVLEMKKLANHYLKLQSIFKRTLELVENYLPDDIAIEAPFYAQNVQSMLKLGRAQGVAMAAGLYRDVTIHEYSPKKIKMAVTGNGNASKEQVAAFLEKTLNQKLDAITLDATDALAVAVCHHYNSKLSVQGGSYKNWGDFLKQNPERLK